MQAEADRGAMTVGEVIDAEVPDDELAEATLLNAGAAVGRDPRMIPEEQEAVTRRDKQARTDDDPPHRHTGVDRTDST